MTVILGSSTDTAEITGSATAGQFNITGTGYATTPQSGVTKLTVQANYAGSGAAVTFDGSASAYSGVTALTFTGTGNLGTANDLVAIPTPITNGDAATVNVDHTSSLDIDTPTGTGTIQNGVDLAGSGGTVSVAKGTYAGGVVVNKSLTVQYTGMATATVTTGSFNDGNTGGFEVSANNVTINGFTLDGSSDTNNSYGVLLLVNTSGATIENNTIGGYGNAILTENGFFGPGPFNALIHNNVFTNTQFGGFALFLQSGHNDTIQGNQFNSVNEGILLFGVSNMTIGGTSAGQANTFTDPGFAAVVYSSTSTSIEDNTVTDAGNTAVSLLDANNGVTITGNAISGGAGSAIDISNVGGAADSNVSIANNILSGNATGIEVDSGSYSGTLTVSGDSITTSGSELAIDDEAATPIDATGETFNGQAASTATTTQLYAIEDTIIDAVDVSGLGLVRIKAGNVYVTPSSFDLSDGTTAPSIQRGIDAASSGDTINVEAGTYPGDVNVDSSVTVIAGQPTTVSGNFSLSTSGAALALATDPAQLTVVNFSAGAGTSTDFNLDNSTTPGTGYDQVVASGTVTISPTATINLTITAGYVPAPGNVFTLINNTGSSPIGGTFTNLTDGSTVVLNGVSFKVDYEGGGGNDLTLTAQGIATPTVVYVGNNTPQDFTITNDVAPAGLSNGDTVTWNPSGTQDPQGPVSGLIFGYNAFTSIQSAINAVASGGIVYVEAGSYAGNLTVANNLSVIGAGSNTTSSSGGGGVDLSLSGGSGVTVTVQGIAFTGGSSAIYSSGVGTLNLTDVASSGNTSGGTFTGTNGTVNLVAAGGVSVAADDSAKTFGTGVLQSISYSGSTLNLLHLGTLGNNNAFSVKPLTGSATTITIDGGTPFPTGNTSTLSLNLSMVSSPVLNYTSLGAGYLTTTPPATTLSWVHIGNVSPSPAAPTDIILTPGHNYHVFRSGTSNVNLEVDDVTSGTIVVFDNAYAGVSSLILSGSGAGTNSVNVDFAAATNPIPSGGLTFNGAGTGNLLRFSNGTFTNTTSTLTGPLAGSVSVDALGTTSYTGVQTVDLTGSSTTNLAFNLPTGSANVAVLQDNGTTSQLSLGGTSTLTKFGNPSSALTVTAGTGTDTLAVGGTLSLGAGGLTINAKTLAVTANVLSVTGGVLTLNGGTITVSGSITSSTALTLTAQTNLTVNTSITASGAVNLTGGAAGTGATITLSAAVTGSSVTAGSGAGIGSAFVVNTTGSSPITLAGLGSGDMYTVNFGSINGAVNIADGGPVGTSQAVLNASGSVPTFNVSEMQSTLGAQTVTYTTALGQLTVNDLVGGGTFNVSPSRYAAMFINGFPPGDTLNFNPLGNTFNIVGNVITTNGGTPPYKNVTFTNIISLPIIVPGTTTADFQFLGSSSSPLQSGYTGVLPTRLYGTGTSGHDYGWLTTLPTAGFDRGASSTSGPYANLLRGGQYAPQGTSGARTFQADVTNGYYMVSVKMGDPSYAWSNMEVTNANTGQVLLSNLNTAVGQSLAQTFIVDVTGGKMDLTFSGLTGGNPYWVVNALDIRPANLLTEGFAPQGPLTADGSTVDSFTLTGATPNSEIVVATTLGTITNTSVDSHIQGTVVLANSMGQATINIRRPFGAGTAYVTTQEVSGAKTGLGIITYQLPTSRLFDFVTSTSPVQTPTAPPTPGGWIGVQTTNAYTSSQGFGWVGTAPLSFDRGAIPGDSVDSNLLRAGAYNFAGTADAGTFRADLPNGTYEVTIIQGDLTLPRGGMNVSVVAGTGAGLTNVTTAAGQWADNSFLATVSAGQLQLQFVAPNSGTYWVVNGIEIRPAANVAAVTFSGPGTVNADGTTTDTITGFAAVPNGTLMTVTTSLGTITSADANAFYAGTQVVVNGGQFTIQIKRPTGGRHSGIDRRCPGRLGLHRTGRVLLGLGHQLPGGAGTPLRLCRRQLLAAKRLHRRDAGHDVHGFSRLRLARTGAGVRSDHCTGHDHGEPLPRRCLQLRRHGRRLPGAGDAERALQCPTLHRRCHKRPAQRVRDDQRHHADGQHQRGPVGVCRLQQRRQRDRLAGHHLQLDRLCVGGQRHGHLGDDRDRSRPGTAVGGRRRRAGRRWDLPR